MPFDSHCSTPLHGAVPMRYVTSREFRVIGELMRWAQEMLIDPQPQLRRSRKSRGETVCPFLYPSIEKGLCYISFGSGAPPDAAALQKQVESHVFQFDSLSLPASLKTYASLMIVFPDAGSSLAGLMDQVHDDLKGQMIRAGFMIARFHPKCKIGSVWNKKLPVFCSPIAFFAIRYMALHDIYFLAENREFFLEYDKRFGHVFQQTKKLSSFYKPIIVAYRLTKARHEKAGLKLT